MAMPPPSSATRSILRSERVWRGSRTHTSPSCGGSRLSPRATQCPPDAKTPRFLFWRLRKQIIGNADGQLSGRVQLLDDAVVFGVILKSASSIDDAGYTEPVDLPHEMTAGVL